MWDQIQQLVINLFNKIKFTVTNINPTQQGEVVFDFRGRDRIVVGEGNGSGIDLATLNALLSNPSSGINIDGSLIIDQTLEANLKIAQRSISETLIELGAIKDELINSLADIDGSKFKAGTIVAGKLYAGEVMAYRIGALNIRTDQAVITGTAQIANAVIVNAHIANVSAGKITAGTITGQEIIVAGGTSGILRSDNYIAGASGWRILGDGSAEFNTVTIRGNIQAGAGSSLNWSYVVGTGKPADNATVGATWGTDLYSIPTRFGDVTPPSGSGLLVSASYMGYYSGGSFKTYIGNNGNFYFGGDGSNYISWNGTSLVVRGNVQATSATFAYAGSSYAGGPATIASDVSFNYAGSSSKGGNANDTNYVNGTASSTISQGSTRANNALDSNSRYTKWLEANSITETKSKTGYTGVIVDGGGISGWSSGTKTFEVNTSGTAYFKGDLGATNITATLQISGGSIKTATSGQRIEQDSSGIRMYDSNSYKRLEWGWNGSTAKMLFYDQNGSLCGELYGWNGSYGAVINANGSSLSADYILACGRDCYLNVSGTSYKTVIYGKLKIPVGTNLYA